MVGLLYWSDTMRKLASIRKIDEIRPIPEADAIEVAVVGGWTVVVKKGEYSPGDLAIYLEIDSWVPHDLAPFLSKGQPPRTYNNVQGERLRTVKLRGQVSQGLLLSSVGQTPITGQEGDDLTESLGIQKWEAPIPAQLAGDVEGSFPGEIPKTDQERIQNLTDQLTVWRDNDQFSWEVTEKLDGSSMTVFAIGERVGVCSRNWSLKESAANTFWIVARRNRLIEKIQGTGRNLALQGELIGEGIQGNSYGIKGQAFRLFDVFDVDNGNYLNPTERQALAKELGIDHVPVISTDHVITQSAHDLLKNAEGKSILNSKAEREGVVYKCNTVSDLSFKAISNKFLLREK